MSQELLATSAINVFLHLRFASSCESQAILAQPNMPFPSSPWPYGQMPDIFPCCSRFSFGCKIRLNIYNRAGVSPFLLISRRQHESDCGATDCSTFCSVGLESSPEVSETGFRDSSRCTEPPFLANDLRTSVDEAVSGRRTSHSCRSRYIHCKLTSHLRYIRSSYHINDRMTSTSMDYWRGHFVVFDVNGYLWYARSWN
ncbi:hypothetical protein BKA93DRAFT_332334 [Sparassis latifolia]